MHLPLNALRAFEASARHLNLTRAAQELHVTQTAVSQHIRNLEERLGKPLFRRLPRGLALTDEGQALLPTLSDAFARMEAALEQIRDTRPREVLTVGVVGTFAVGWLLPRLRHFQQSCPFVDLRLLTHNNRVDMAGEGLDYAIRFGDGAWHGTHAERILQAPLSAMCTPALAQGLQQPADLARLPLLRSYRADEWTAWFAAAGLPCPVLRGAVFDSSLTLAEAAAQGAGVALLPVALFTRELQQGRLVQPFALELQRGAYWLTHLQSRSATAAMQAFAQWLQGACRTWSVESENRPQRGQFLPDLQPHRPAMGQEDGKKWTAEVDLQPTISESGRLLEQAHSASAGLPAPDAAVPEAKQAPFEDH